MNKLVSTTLYSIFHIQVLVKKNMALNINGNQNLLIGFFQAAIPLLREDGEIHVTIKTGQPYESWGVTRIGTKSKELRLKCAFPFNPRIYSGYTHRRTLGFEEGLSNDDNIEILKKKCRTYVFDKNIEKEEPKKKKKKEKKLG